jgi:hypothetical protein
MQQTASRRGSSSSRLQARRRRRRRGQQRRTHAPQHRRRHGRTGGGWRGEGADLRAEQRADQGRELALVLERADLATGGEVIIMYPCIFPQ